MFRFRKKFLYRTNVKARKKLTWFFPVIFLPLVFFGNAPAQQLATTQDGSLVILYKDGSWSYAPAYEINDSRNNRCNFEVNHIEPVTGQKKTLLKKVNFISYSYELLKKDNQSQDYVQCDLALGEEDGKKVVYLDYVLQTSRGLYNFGIIQEGKKLLIKLKNKATVELVLLHTDKGLMNTENNETYYHTYSVLNPKEEENLKTSEAETVLMPWSLGDEIYPVNYPKAFIDQLICFD